MRSFAELLTEYMRRTGISDSELARTLGVRRQTIFRWKEGLVERPRSREDVLRCAARLRLTTAERDELLLAAGFPPESARVPTLVRTVGTAEAASQTDHSSPARVVETVELPAPAHAPPSSPSRTISRRAAITLATAALLLLATSAALLRIRPSSVYPTYPVASPGETLIVLSSFGSSPATATDGNLLGSSMIEPIRAVLEREIRAARLDRVRVVEWPEAIRDGSEAELVRQRARAKVVIGGMADSGHALAMFIMSSPAARVEDRALDALIAEPRNLRVHIATVSPEEAQAMALMILSQVYVERGDFGRARAVLTQALAQPPTDPAAQASLYTYLGYVHHISKPPDLNQAISAYEQAIGRSETTVAYLNRGLAFVRQDRPDGWRSDFARVLALEPDRVDVQQALCWAYALGNQPDLALPHCDAAVKSNPTGYSREARGIVYAELGRLPEAAAELESFVDWLAQQPEGVRIRYGSTRAEWLQALRAGHNPIDEAVLARLRLE